jgi:hypothetical protein
VKCVGEYARYQCEICLVCLDDCGDVAELWYVHGDGKSRNEVDMLILSMFFFVQEIFGVSMFLGEIGLTWLERKVRKF